MSNQNEQLRTMGRLIADDGFAVSFQSLGQYRAALLKELVRLYGQPEALPAPTADSCGSVRCDG